jgi:hypothetical protein
VTNKQDFASLLTEIDHILSGAISSLVNPQEVAPETIASTCQRLESARALLSTLLFPDSIPDVAHWSLGIEVQHEGVKIVFFRESQGTIDLYPLSWSLATGETDRLPWPQINDYLINWLSQGDFDRESWLFEALERLEAIFIADDGETPTDDLQKAIITAKLISPDHLYSLETAIATALAYIPTTDQTQTQTLLVIEGKQEHTNLALLEVPRQTRCLSRQAIALSHFNYGENTYEAAILSHLIYPLWRPWLPFSLPNLEDSHLASLAAHPLKKPLLETAKLTKLILQKQSEFTSSLAGHTWTVHRDELNQIVTLPYINLLKQNINNLLEKQGKSPTDIDQIIFSGDFFENTWSCLSSLLQEELPTSHLHPPTPESISPVVMGLGRLSLFSALALRNGNNA